MKSGTMYTKPKLLALVGALALAIGILATCGCTKREEKIARETGGAISRAAGLPPFVGEGIATLITSALAYVGGHKRGRSKERRCHVPNAKASA